MTNLFRLFVQEDSGQDMIEYVLILGFVCVAAAAIITGVGTEMTTVWSVTNKHVNNAAVKALQ